MGLLLGLASKALRGPVYSVALGSPEKGLENCGEQRKCWEGPKSLQGKGTGEVRGLTTEGNKFFQEPARLVVKIIFFPFTFFYKSCFTIYVQGLKSFMPG